ncbi:hypothetical protein [Streptomyces griseus]|uniref:hypothetical protein n=1 Tax=Streptomyces griseus TaxID=1911 RepID=UPI000A7C3A4F|nr:hypothetical protein [Streptomyces griseus]
MSAAAVATTASRTDGKPVTTAPLRRQRVRVPMRLVASAHYQDVVLAVYVKVKALGLRPEGCQARTETIASYLGLSRASVERAMTQLSRPGPDGVVELRSRRRTLPGGRGRSAVRSVRSMSRDEAFVWLPVATAEDLTPRQLRAYALLAYAQARGIAPTTAELASGLRHHSGRKAGRALSVTAASRVVDEVESARWVTVQRRAGERGRHRYVVHDIAPEARPADPGPWGAAVETAVDSASVGASGPQAGEGSGSPVDEGSLAKRESPRTDSPDDARAPVSPAVGEVPVVKGPGPVEKPAASEPPRPEGDGGGAHGTGGDARPTRPRAGHRGGQGPKPPYTGPPLAMSAQIHAVLRPVHVLLERVDNDFTVREIAREVGRQLRAGTSPERLQHRLTTRLARVMLCDIRDPGRWLLGVALPRWGCGHYDCEAGYLWRTGEDCEICTEIIQDRAAARQRALRKGTGPGPRGPAPTARRISARPARPSAIRG